MEKTNDIVFVNYILDNVHGFIGLTELEDRIERLPIFKRLQDITQLGMVKRIFPGAVHNRYIHSLGVMYMIDKMAVCLGQFNLAERQLLRLAAMLHDLGHYPLSHDLEQVYNAQQQIINNTEEITTRFRNEAVDKLKKYYITDDSEQKGLELDVEIQGLGGKYSKCLVARSENHHEAITGNVILASKKIQNLVADAVEKGRFDQLDNELSKKEDKNEIAKTILIIVCKLIQGDMDFNYGDTFFSEHYTAMVQLLHSELDADRIDYLLRDASFSGTSYGSFDLNMLLQNLDMYKYRDKIWVIGVKEKGIACADQYMINRFLAYSQVICHKYTSIIGKMLREVVSSMICYTENTNFITKNNLLKVINAHETSHKYYFFTDSYFIQKLESVKDEELENREDIIYFIKQLRDFKALEVLEEDIFVGKYEEQRNHFRKSLLYNEIQSSNINNNCLYLFDKKQITNHLPHEQFLRQCELSGLKDEKIESAQIDRLMDGLAIIYKDKEPELLIDSQSSILKELYCMEKTFLRKYKYTPKTSA